MMVVVMMMMMMQLTMLLLPPLQTQHNNARSPQLQRPHETGEHDAGDPADGKHVQIVTQLHAINQLV